MPTKYTPMDILRMTLSGNESFVLATDYAALEAEIAKEKEGSRCFELTAKGCVMALENEKKELEARLASLDQKFMILQGSHDLLLKERDALARRINPDGAPVDVAALCLEIDTVTDERDELKRRCELYEARERADNETLHEFADYLSDKHAIAEGRDNG